MRIVGVRKSRQINFEQLVFVQLFDGVQTSLVAARECFDDFLRLFVRELLLQIVIAKLLPPELFGLSQIARTRRVLAVPPVSVVPREIEGLGFQQLLDVCGPLLQPLLQPLENPVRRTRIPSPSSCLFQTRAVGRKLLDILLQEELPARIERLQISIEESGGQLSIEMMGRVMRVLQQARGCLGDVCLVAAGISRAVQPRCQPRAT